MDTFLTYIPISKRIQYSNLRQATTRIPIPEPPILKPYSRTSTILATGNSMPLPPIPIPRTTLTPLSNVNPKIPTNTGIYKSESQESHKEIKDGKSRQVRERKEYANHGTGEGNEGILPRKRSTYNPLSKPFVSPLHDEEIQFPEPINLHRPPSPSTSKSCVPVTIISLRARISLSAS
jgi:hypothetical protein